VSQLPAGARRGDRPAREQAPPHSEPTDVRLRMAAAAPAREDAQAIVREVLALYTCGPAGGGGVRTSVSPRLGSDSCYVPREWLRPGWRFAP
jgi:hypothetical protein